MAVHTVGHRYPAAAAVAHVAPGHLQLGQQQADGGRPTAAAPARPTPPPPYAAPAAMRRATLALDMLVMRRRHLLVAVHPLLAPYCPCVNLNGE